MRVPGAEGDELRRLADAARRLIECTVSVDAPAEELAAAAERVETVADTLERWVPSEPTFDLPDLRQTRRPQQLFPMSPVVGHFNPLAPPVEVWADGARIEGRAWFGSAYEGPPGCVHGGVIAGTFDELLGLANVLYETAGMTGRLVVRYRRPTPLRTELRVAAETEAVRGRKITTHGWIWHGDELTAEAEGLFVMARERVRR